MSVQRFSGRELREYWQTVGSTAESRQHDTDLLAVVCGVGGPLWYNRYFARFQRVAFLRALAHCGSLERKAVLEIGCGGGRWSRLLRDRGAAVMAVDVSQAVIARNRRLISGVEFVCADLLDLDPRPHVFDAAVSVTVLQHLPFQDQETAAERLVQMVRTGGYIVLLENTSDQDRHVFSRGQSEWVSLFTAAGCRLVYARGYGYDLPVRWWSAMVRVVRWSSKRRRFDAACGPGEWAESRMAASRRGIRKLYTNIVYRPLIGLSYPFEALCNAMCPDSWATHVALVLQKN